MDTPLSLYDETYMEAVRDVRDRELDLESTTTAIKNLETLSKCRPPEPPETSTETPEPTTFWGKVAVQVACVWDNETTRTLIKAGGAFAGVALVAHQTVRKDHVLERQALAQANQRPS